MIKVMLVDDQVILRESIKFIIEQDAEISVVACAGDGREAIQLCGKYTPDIILMDILMPICDGVEATKTIKCKYPSTKIIILTTFGDEENVAKALQNGAEGYVLKDINPEELIMTIKSASRGLHVVHQDAFRTISKNFSTHTQINKMEKNCEVHLTEREQKIVMMIVEGHSNKEIAKALFLAEGSVKNAVTGILDKFQFKDRLQLAVYAVKNNLI